MIDTDKYKGHTPIEFWQVVGQGEMEENGEHGWHIPYWMSLDTDVMGVSRADRNLIQDAPLLLAEVKRLHKEITYIVNGIGQVASDAFSHMVIEELRKVIE